MVDTGPNETAHEAFEVFSDPSYYDMWCVRPNGSKDFNSTLHFTTQQHANHASHVVADWMQL